jgi:hypothetical protein
MQLTKAEIDTIEAEEGGRGLRARLESALAENRTLDTENASFKAISVLEEHELNLVQPDDLAGVAASDMEEKAKALQVERVEGQKLLARSVFEQKGLTGDELDSAVNDFLSVPEASGAKEGSSYERLRSVGRIEGDRIGTTVNTDGMSGADLLYAAEAQGSKK